MYMFRPTTCSLPFRHEHDEIVERDIESSHYRNPELPDGLTAKQKQALRNEPFYHALDVAR